MDLVKCNDQNKRPQELNYLKGDSSRIRELGWVPEYDTAKTLDEMIEYWETQYTDPYLQTI